MEAVLILKCPFQSKIDAAPAIAPFRYIYVAKFDSKYFIQIAELVCLMRDTRM
jgi:hypothetical protein